MRIEDSLTGRAKTWGLLLIALVLAQIAASLFIPRGTALTIASDLIQGTLEMLILKTLALEAMHGYGVALRIEQISGGVFRVNPGSLLPALSRMERAGRVKAAWRVSENNRRAKYYDLTAKGRKALEEERRQWDRQSAAIGRILEA